MNDLNLTFVALSDPTRRLIIERLRRGSMSVNELAEPFGMSQQAVSKHLAYLERAGLVEKRREGRQQFCALRPAPLREAYDWIEGYRQFWDEALDRLDILLTDLKRKPKPKERQPHARKTKSSAR